jgi:hypothetical protein
MSFSPVIECSTLHRGLLRHLEIQLWSPCKRGMCRQCRRQKPCFGVGEEVSFWFKDCSFELWVSREAKISLGVADFNKCLGRLGHWVRDCSNNKSVNTLVIRVEKKSFPRRAATSCTRVVERRTCTHHEMWSLQGFC